MFAASSVMIIININNKCMEKKCEFKIRGHLQGVFLFILLFVSSICGKEAYSQEKRMTLEMENTTLGQVLEKIGQQQDIEFVYTTSVVDVNERMSVSMRNSTLKEVLDTVLGKKYSYTIQGRYVMVRKKDVKGNEDKPVYVELKGVVKDEQGELLPGVSIVLKGTTVGTATDVKGEFKLLVPKSVVPMLKFSFIGMQTVEVEWTKNKKELVLHENVAMMEEVTVTTGYQTIEKKRMTGAVDVVTAREIENKGYVSVGDVLRGAMAGVSTRNVSGKPGTLPEVRIRGLNSLYGSMEPMWIVDGAPFYGSLNDIEPEDIESITVLKDAAATAIYGSQAANGVIVIKRKRGSEGQAAIRVTANFSIEAAPKNKLDLMNSEEKIAFERSIYEDFPNITSGGRVTTLLRNADIGKITRAEAEAEIERLSKINTNWFDVIFQTAFSQNHSISLSGGTEKNQYYASLSYRRTEGVVPTNIYENWGGYLRFTQQFNDWCKINFDISSTVRTDKDSEMSVNPLRYATYANPYERPYDEEGNLEYDRSYTSELSSLKDGYKYDFNIVDEMKRNTSTKKSMDNSMTLELNFQVLKGLKLSTRGSVFNNSHETRTIWDPGSYTSKLDNWMADVYAELPDELNKGALAESNSRSQGWTWRNSLEFGQAFNEKHFVSVYIGHEVSEYKSNSNYVKYPEYDSEKGLMGVPELDGVEDIKKKIMKLLDGPSESQNRSVSFFVSGSYSFMDRYIFAGSIRLDGADIIGTANRFSPLWNASFKYNMNEEQFMKDVSWVDELAFRVSYGYTGSIDKNALPFGVMTFSTTDEYFGYDVPTYIQPKNPSVKWQKKEDRSVGVDFAFLNRRLRGTVNYYNNVTRNLLDTKDLPISVGVSSIKYNSSSVRNFGWEFSVNSQVVRAKDWLWRVDFNMGINKSKVIDTYYKDITEVPKGYDKTTPIEGASTNAWFGYRFAGIDPRTGHTLAYVDNSKRATPIGFRREDGRWVLDMDDTNDTNRESIKENLGDSYPAFSGGFGTNLSWKDFTFDVDFSFMAGHKITAAYYATSAGGSVSAASQNVLKKEATRWRKPGDVTDIPGYSSEGSFSSLYSEWYDLKLEKGDFLKCTSMSIGYRLPSKICRKFMVNSLRVNLNVRDVFTISGYSGLDPENFGGFSYPNTRKYMISLNIGI